MANLRVLMSLSVAAAMVLQMSPSACVQAASKKDKPKPAGTVLLPLTPKIDDGSTPPSAAPKPTAAASAASASSASTATNSSGDSAPDAQATAAGTSSNAPHNVKVDPIQPIAPSAVAAQPNISAEVGNDETAGDPGIDQNTLLKGTVQIVADDTEYDQEKNTF